MFHRGHAQNFLPESVQHIIGDRNALTNSVPEFHRFAPDVVVDFILSSERQARDLMSAMRGITGRVVALSSGDVYRAAAILHRLDPGPLQPVPLTEESELRINRNPYTPEVLTMLRTVFPWLDTEYDKIPVEQIVMGDSEIRGTVLRLPMVYGPGDPLHRLHPILKRIDDGRPAILMQEEAAQWRGLRGYVENVAAAIALAATSPQAAGRIYNVAEAEVFSDLEWARARGPSRRMEGKSDRIAERANAAASSNCAQRRPTLDRQQRPHSRRTRATSEPISLDTALERTIAWERANPPAKLDPKQFDYAAEDAAL